MSKQVVWVQSCFRYYMSDDISKDADGTDAQCRYSCEPNALVNMTTRIS